MSSIGIDMLRNLEREVRVGVGVFFHREGTETQRHGSGLTTNINVFPTEALRLRRLEMGDVVEISYLQDKEP